MRWRTTDALGKPPLVSKRRGQVVYERCSTVMKVWDLVPGSLYVYHGITVPVATNYNDETTATVVGGIETGDMFCCVQVEKDEEEPDGYWVKILHPRPGNSDCLSGWIWSNGNDVFTDVKL